ncbi:TIGR04219 family outer membrane beta-barrel protein [Thalassotalea nanhaiensis]|uniref:TIGR04219 family outer membrane beta-barrel protein n=1 Tax=Thalassotalea nanhaiensis TaxID=3065648 RepID=A0ABY9TNF8_9GAMM|nr:TIGR04219 family outer membrane beta-barrel protein [Colwelliaceae bacterium SQ345]
MNKTAALISSLMLLTSTTAAADAIGVYVGAQGWDMAAEGSHGENNDLVEYNFKDESQGRFYLAFEHPIPFIPNIKIAHSELMTKGLEVDTNSEFANLVVEGSEVDFTYTDYTLYYELFDNGLFSFDLGLTAKDFEGELLTSDVTGLDEDSVDEIIPMAYAYAQVAFPGTGLSVFAEGNFLSIDDHTLVDYQAGIAYALIDNMLIDVNLSAGYRKVDLELDDLDNVYADLEFDGAFAGVEVHF